jgi:hypothetical protein
MSPGWTTLERVPCTKGFRLNREAALFRRHKQERAQVREESV